MKCVLCGGSTAVLQTRRRERGVVRIRVCSFDHRMRTLAVAERIEAVAERNVGAGGGRRYQVVKP